MLGQPKAAQYLLKAALCFRIKAICLGAWAQALDWRGGTLVSSQRLRLKYINRMYHGHPEKECPLQRSRLRGLIAGTLLPVSALLHIVQLIGKWPASNTGKTLKMNSSDASSQPAPDIKREAGEGRPDNKLPENSQENLDARLDHAVEETFPTSDPISVHITKGPEPDHHDQEAPSSSAEDHLEESEQDFTEQLLDQVREALLDVSDSVAGAAQDAYNQGSHYVRQAREQYPEAERYIREGQRAVTHRVTGNPLLALFIAGVAGYALAWMIHGQRKGRGTRVPDHGRTSRGYAPHRER
jgi:ElaB/YqjD/DUF883 family membrane-anchored ribosome-binding protein